MRIIREECFNKNLIVNARSPGKLLNGYTSYYNNWRTHSACDGNAPIPRQVMSRPCPDAKIATVKLLNGLVTHYTWSSGQTEDEKAA